MKGLRHFPVQLTRFVGRQRALDELGDVLREARLLTLTGVGGSGKTRLAVELARRVCGGFADGAVFADLAPLADPSLVPGAVAASLGVAEPADGDVARVLVEAIGSRRLLLVADNCEHVLPACTALVSRLLVTCAGLTVLATSREPLGVSDEIVRPVDPLGRPDPFASLSPDEIAGYEAVRLLVDRASLVRHGFAVNDENSSAVARLVQRLDGIPLAIELAAPWLRTLGPRQLAHRLDDRFGLLVRGRPEAPARHQTLRAVVDWSYELLEEAERLLFARASVFTGGFTLDACEAVRSGDGDVVHALAGLVEKSIVTTADARGDVRYGMLETIREYGLERLGAGGDERNVRDAHLRWFAEWVGTGPGTDPIEAEHANCRAALYWSLESGDAAIGLRLAVGLSRFWRDRAHLTEGRSWLERLLAAATSIEPELRAKALSAAGDLAFSQADREGARPYFDEALALYGQLGDERREAVLWRNIGNVEYEAGAYDAARQAYERSLSIFSALGERADVRATLSNLGNVHTDLGNTAKARELLEESLQISRELGDARGAAITLVQLGIAARGEGDLERARDLFERALAAFREAGDELNASSAMYHVATVARMQGDRRGARTLFEGALPAFRNVENHRAVSSLLMVLGSLDEEDDDIVAAAHHFSEALDVCRSIPGREGAPGCLEALAGILARSGDRVRSARLLGAAEIAREQEPRSAADEDAVGRTTALLGEGDDVKAALADGRVLPLDDAIDEAIAAAESVRAARGVTLLQEGEYWTVRAAGRELRLKDSKGLRYIAALVNVPGRDVHVLDLVAPGAPRPPHGGDVIDAAARSSYRRRLDDLDAEIAEARAWQDPVRAEHAELEREAVAREVARTLRRGRQAAPEVEKARLNVTRAIKSAIDRIAARDHEVGEQLRTDFRTGTYCVYRPGSQSG